MDTGLYNAIKMPLDTDFKQITEVKVDGGTTLSQFIKSILKDKNDSGIILIQDEEEPLGEYIYKSGFIISTPRKRYLSRTIVSVNGIFSGSRKDYLIKIDESRKEKQSRCD